MKKHRTEKSERVSGDLLFFFGLHNLISVLFFFLFTYFLGVYAGREDVYNFSWIQVIGYLINSEFWKMTILQIFPILIITGLLGRVTAFYGIKGYYAVKDRNQETKRATKRWSELNTKINRIGIKFFITALITSFIYSIGIISLLSQAVFQETTLLPLIIMYSVVKIITFIGVRWLVGSKL